MVMSVAWVRDDEHRRCLCLPDLSLPGLCPCQHLCWGLCSCQCLLLLLLRLRLRCASRVLSPVVAGW